MRKIREILRLLLFIGISHRQIARAVSVGRSTVDEYAEKASALGLTWAAVEQLGDNELERMFFPAAQPEQTASKQRPVPDWAEVHKELQQDRNLTLMQIWREYRQQHPDGYGFSRFHEYFSRWRKKQSRVMRQLHRAGEKVFVDFGQGPVIETETGEKIQTQLFVAVWGASNYTFVRASASQDLPSWIRLHTAAFEFFGCVPHILVPDNLKSAVSRACRYEPDLNPTYQDLAVHYGTAVVPARPYKPKDKAKVESAVRLVNMWILAPLRKKQFRSLAELNAAIQEILKEFNNRIMRRMKVSRRELFETLDRPAALALPADRFEFCHWKKDTITSDYHIRIDDHDYSVPHALVGSKVESRITANTIEVLHRGVRVASHARSCVRGGCSTLPEHMPEAHRRQAAATPEALFSWAQETGAATAELFESIRRRHRGSASTMNAWRGICNLGHRHGQQRIEEAAVHALAHGACSFAQMKKILEKNLDRLQAARKSTMQPLPDHGNVRGSEYYAEAAHAE